MAQAEPTLNVVSPSSGGGDGGGWVTIDIPGDHYVTATASTSMAPCSPESSSYMTACLNEVQIRAAIEKSKDQGWSELAKGGIGKVVGAGSLSAADALIWEKLKEQLPHVFIDNVKVKLGRVIAEGSQAQICEVEVDSAICGKGQFVAKVFKKEGFSLANFKKQWPLTFGTPGMPIFGVPSLDTFCMNVDYGLFLEDGRFMFLIRRCWGDLRMLINLQLENNNHQGPPFSDLQAMKFLLHIALGVNWLHQRGALHRDLKAANVLICTNDSSFKQGGAFNVDENCTAYVADFETSLMVQGTGFWRAPEVLKELQKPPCNRNIQIWKSKVDVYSYAMTCYEILTAFIPFVGYYKSDWDRIIVHGERPQVPDYVNPKLKDLMERCWHGVPSKRPSFQAIIHMLRSMLPKDQTNIIVGQDDHRKKLKSWLLTRETKAASVAGTYVIAGMGGIGKTTLAKSLLEDPDIKNHYDHRVYWIAVKRHPNIIECQRRLLFEICEEIVSVEFDSEKLLQEEIKRKLSKLRRVLLFLDDVWEKSHVDSLLGDSFMETFPPESKCVITSRKPAELEKLDTYVQIEKLDVLNDDDARTLFCSKAFKNGKIPTDTKLRVVVEEVIAACGKLPLALRLIAAYQQEHERSIESWEILRDRLNSRDSRPESKSDNKSILYHRLERIIYHDLPVWDSASGEGIDFKDYFLDFAAFPEREGIEIAALMDMWTKPGLTEDAAYRILEELERRCLVNIVGNWCHVHDIIRDLAVKLVEEQPLKKRKTLFAWELSNNRLPEKWAISQNVRPDEIFETEKMVIARSELKEFHPTDAILFTCLTRLRMLSLTSNLNLVSLPAAVGCMKSLEKLDLSWCLGLEKLPREIGQLEGLEKLNLAGCCSLTEIPAEIGKLKELTELNMQSCSIEKLPDEIGELTRLTYLCLNDCNQLEALPDALGKLSSLEKLECDFLRIREIPRALGDLSMVKHLSFDACVGVTEIPAEFVKLKNLITFSLVNSVNLEVVPDELDKLVTEGNLAMFYIWNTKVVWERLPPNLRALSQPFDGTIKDDEADSMVNNPDGPYWSHRRGMLVNTHPSNKEQSRLSFVIDRVVTLAKNEPFLSLRFNMVIRVIFAVSKYIEAAHAIEESVPVLLRCIDKGEDHDCCEYAATTLSNMCVTWSTHKAIVNVPQGFDILTRALHRNNHVSHCAFQALLRIREADKMKNDWMYYSEILEKCGHAFGHEGCACIWCEHWFRKFKVKNVF